MPAFESHHDARIRAAAFGWLSEQVARHGDVLPRDVIAQGLEVVGTARTPGGPSGHLQAPPARRAHLHHDHAEQPVRRHLTAGRPSLVPLP